MASRPRQNWTTKQRNDQRWDAMKEEIYQTLIADKSSLTKTMEIIKVKHSFSASERKWKMKLNEWEFTKYIPSTEMRFMGRKAERRLHEENKDTLFHYRGVILDQKRLDKFKKKGLNLDEPVSDVSTPTHIVYHTPSSMDSDDTDGYTESITTQMIPVDNPTSIDHCLSNLKDTIFLPESDQFVASHGYNPHTDGKHSERGVGNHVDVQKRGDQVRDMSTQTPWVVSGSGLSMISSENNHFSRLLDLRDESHDIGESYKKALENTLGTLHIHGQSPKLTRYLNFQILEEDLNFIMEAIQCVRYESSLERYTNIFAVDFSPKQHRPLGFWDQFIGLIKSVLVERSSTPQELYWSQFAEFVYSCKTAFGFANCITIGIVCRYAEFLMIMGSSSQAIHLLQEVIAELPKYCVTLRTCCSLSLAAFLFLIHEYHLAVKTLVSVINLDGDASNGNWHLEIFSIGLSRFLDIMTVDISSTSHYFVSTIKDIQRIITRYSYGGMSSEIDALVSLAEIADKLSNTGSFSLADELFTSITAVEASCSRLLYGSKISKIFIALSSHHHRQNMFHEFRDDILKISNCLADASLDLAAKEMLSSLYLQWERGLKFDGSPKREKLSLIDLRIVKELQEIQKDPSIINSDPQLYPVKEELRIGRHYDEVDKNGFHDIELADDGNVDTQATIEGERELSVRIPFSGDATWETYGIPTRKPIREGDTMTECTSNKYGVTFSVSEMTGISYSEFMAP